MADKKNFVRHPDVPRAIREYGRGNKDSFAEMKARRREIMIKAANGETQGRDRLYWDPTHDGRLKNQARRNTRALRERARQEGRDIDREWKEAGRRKVGRNRKEADLLRRAQRAGRNDEFYPDDIFFERQKTGYESELTDTRLSQTQLDNAIKKGRQEAQRIMERQSKEQMQKEAGNIVDIRQRRQEATQGRRTKAG